MNKYLLVGDLQLQKSNIPSALKLFEIIESYKLPVIFLGDLLERRGLIEAECLNVLFEYLSTSPLFHTIIAGNHDLTSLHDTRTSLEPLRALPRVNVYSKPGQLGNMLFMPYYRNPKNFLDDIALWLPRLPKDPILMCHQGIKEFTIDSGYTEEEAVEVKDLEAFKLVVAGHYHFCLGKGNIVYLGSPFSHSFGESNQHKRLGILDTSTAEIEYIPLGNTFPRHVTIELDLDKGEKELNITNTYDYTRVIVSGSEENLKLFQKNTQRYQGVKYIYRQTGSVTSATISETLTNSDKWIKWAKDIKNLDSKTVEAGLELLK